MTDDASTVLDEACWVETAVVAEDAAPVEEPVPSRAPCLRWIALSSCSSAEEGEEKARMTHSRA